MVSIIDIRQAGKFDGFDFNKMREGLVVENAMYDKKGSVYVAIPELTVGFPEDRAVNTQASIDSSKFYSNNPDIKYNTQFTHANYVECLPIIFNHMTIGSAKPRIGDTVMVFFLNGDVKLPYYINAHPLKEGEQFMDSSNEIINRMDGYGYYRLIKLMDEPMYGADVHLVGEKLAHIGLDIKPKSDGTYYYDPEMFNAVLLFQRRVGLTEDGEVGPITFRILMRFNGIIGDIENEDTED